MWSEVDRAKDDKKLVLKARKSFINGALRTLSHKLSDTEMIDKLQDKARLWIAQAKKEEGIQGDGDRTQGQAVGLSAAVDSATETRKRKATDPAPQTSSATKRKVPVVLIQSAVRKRPRSPQHRDPTGGDSEEEEQEQEQDMIPKGEITGEMLMGKYLKTAPPCDGERIDPPCEYCAAKRLQCSHDAQEGGKGR
ncbi:hypothetical protein C0992_000180 [Termitomyces sp. T32_za158]|nr:hypothetical protein C0992_000180 [Termitomyces sp. T32_za158]